MVAKMQGGGKQKSRTKTTIEVFIFQFPSTLNDTNQENQISYKSNLFD